MIAYDIYAGLWVPRAFLTREHIIPQSIMKKYCPIGKDSVENIGYTMYMYNNMRSNYKFVPQFGTKDENMFIVDTKARVCYPGPARFIIAEACSRMMERYPILLEHSTEFIDPEAYFLWAKNT